MRTRIWIPEQVEQNNNMPVIVIPIGTISGHYMVELLSRDNTIISTWSFDNIITNAGMDAIGSRIGAEIDELFNFMQTGAGSTTPSGSDTNLQTPITGRIAQLTSTGSLINTDASGSFYTRELTYLFTELLANGNITELGIFTLVTDGRLVNRALVRDVFGAPTTITKTSDNQLRVKYTYKVYVPTADVTGSITLGAVTHTYVIRPQLLSSSLAWGTSQGGGSPLTTGGYTHAITERGWASAPTFFGCSPSGTLVTATSSLTISPITNASSVDAIAYVNNDYYRDIDAIWEPSDANFGSTGIKMFRFRAIGRNSFISNPGAWTHQMEITPNILKVNTQRLTLRFRFGWSRARTSE